MTFKKKIIELESKTDNNVYSLKIGKLPVVLTAPHTIRQIKNDGTIKPGEPYTKAIAMYVAN